MYQLGGILTTKPGGIVSNHYLSEVSASHGRGRMKALSEFVVAFVVFGIRLCKG